VTVPELQPVTIGSVCPRNVQALIGSIEWPEAVLPVKEPPLVISIGNAIPQAYRGPISSAPAKHIQAKPIELQCKGVGWPDELGLFETVVAVPDLGLSPSSDRVEINTLFGGGQNPDGAN
jgi:hypothetical protein